MLNEAPIGRFDAIYILSKELHFRFNNRKTIVIVWHGTCWYRHEATKVTGMRQTPGLLRSSETEFQIAREAPGGSRLCKEDEAVWRNVF